MLLKRIFDNPLISQGVHSSIIYLNFHWRMKKNSTCVYPGKKSAHQAWKTSQTVSARFSSYKMNKDWTFSLFLHFCSPGLVISLDVLPSWADKGSRSPSAYIMIFSTVALNAVKESVLSHLADKQSVLSVLSHLVDVFHLFVVLKVLLSGMAGWHNLWSPAAL